MDVPAIGAHCALSSCNVNDFLPIKCKCERLYCRDHIFPEAHECPVAAASASPSNPLSSTKLERCAFETCKKPSLEAFLSASTREDAAGRSAALCEGCKKAFCAEYVTPLLSSTYRILTIIYRHREPQSHACVPLPGENQKPEEKNAKARALLNKHFPTSTPTAASAGSSKTASEKIANPKKLAQIKQVQLMKMRHKAKPGDPRDKPTSVSVDQRLHLQVSKESSTDVTPFWFRKV